MNLGYMLTKAAKQWPGRIAIAYGDQELTYRQLNDRVNALANAFKGLGVREGDRVAIWQHNCPQLLETIFACFKTKAIVVPLNARFIGEEAVYHINDSESAMVVFEKNFEKNIQEIRQEIHKVQHYVCLSNPYEGMLDYETLISKYSTKKDQTVYAEDDDLAWLFYTSGTTGRPKGAMLTHGNLWGMTMNCLADLVTLNHEDVGLHCAPLTHASGLYALPCIARGATNVILKAPRFEPKFVFETIEKRKVTHIMFLTPTMINRLVRPSEMNRYDLSSLKYIIYGGSPMYVEDLKIAVRNFGKIFVQLYGQAESPMTGTYLRREEHIIDGAEKQLRRLMSAGITRTDIELKIVDENDNEVPQGEMGEMLLRGRTVMKGYWRRPEASAETLKGGWLHTGDIGYLDEDGYVYIMDRKKDMIKSGGVAMWPREIEEVILRHPAVKEAAVIGIPDSEWGEGVHAIIVLKDGEMATEQEIINFCKKHMASYKKPKSIEFLKSLPVSAYGKILKRELRERYWLGRERKV